MIHLETDLDKAIYSQIENVQDPEIGLPITELGLIYEVKAEDSKALINSNFLLFLFLVYILWFGVTNKSIFAFLK